MSECNDRSRAHLQGVMSESLLQRHLLNPVSSHMVEKQLLMYRLL